MGIFCSIAAQTYNPLGAVLLDAKANSSLSAISRRVSRTATLDGSALIADSGFSHADRTFDIRAPAKLSQAETLRSILASHSRITVAVPEGVFLGALESMDVQTGELSVRILILEKLSASP